MGSWVFGSDTTALAFTQAELSFLFPAPLSRRALIGYKLFRAQIAVLINALIWVFVLRRGGGPLPAIASRGQPVGAVLDAQPAPARRGAGPVVVARARRRGRATPSLVDCRVRVDRRGGRHEPHRSPRERSPMRPGSASSSRRSPACSRRRRRRGRCCRSTRSSRRRSPRPIPEWAREMLPALAVLAIHATWVLRTDAAFEDAAIEASAERARRLEAMRTRRTIAATAAPRAAKAPADVGRRRSTRRSRSSGRTCCACGARRSCDSSSARC